MLPLPHRPFRERGLQTRSLRLRGALLFCCALFSVGFLAQRASAQSAGEGRDFTVAIPYLAEPDGNPSQFIRFHVRSVTGAEVRFSYGEGGRPDQVLTLAPNSADLLFVDTNDLVLPRASGLYTRTMRVRADNPISLTVLLDRGTASEAFEAIPHRFLGYEYVTMNQRSILFGSDFVVAAVEDSTIVTITPSRPTLEGRPAGIPFEVQLDEGEIYQVVSELRSAPEINDDLSGSRVVADRPVALFSASSCSNMPVGNITCNPLIEQLPHVDALGRTHVFPIFPEQRTDFLKGVPVCAPTRVVSTDILPAMDEVFYGDSGTLYRVGSSGIVTSENPILLGHITTNLSRTPPTGVTMATGDPTLSILTPDRQMASRYLVEIPAIGSRNDGGFSIGWTHTISIVRIDPTVTVTVNGVPFPMTGPVGSTDYLPGLYDVRASGPVGVTVSGRSVSDAYAFVPGLVTREFALRSDTLRGLICGDRLDTIITLENRSGEVVTIDSGSFVNGLDGEIVTPLPITVNAGERVDLQISFRRSSPRVEGRLLLFDNNQGCPRRVMIGRIFLERNELLIRPGGTIQFPELTPPSRTRDTTITLRNVGRIPVSITEIVIEPSQFRLLSPVPSLPFEIAPGDSLLITLRFESDAGVAETRGRITFLTEPCPGDSIYRVDLAGTLRGLRTRDPDLVRDTIICDEAVRDTLVAWVINDENIPLQIDSLMVIGGNPGEFTLIGTGDQPRVVPQGDSIPLRVLYRSGAAEGDRRATLQVWGGSLDFGPRTLPLEVRLESYRFEIVPANLDFDRVDCDTVEPRSVVIRNVGTLRIEHNSIDLLNGTRFQLSANRFDPIEPGEELVVSIAPIVLPGLFLDTLVITDSLCGTRVLLPLRVACVDVGEIALSLPDLSGTIGDLLDIPLMIERRPARFGVGAAFVLEITLRYRADLLHLGEGFGGLPDGVTGEVRGDLVDPILDRRVSIRFEGKMAEANLLATLPMTLLLGNGNHSPIEFEEVSLDFMQENIDLTVETQDGSVTLDGYCTIGGTRWIEATGAFGMKVVSRPGEITLLLDLVEDGAVSIELYAVDGRLVTTIFDGSPGSGRWRIDETTRSFPSGTYYISLQTPTRRVVQPLQIGE